METSLTEGGLNLALVEREFPRHQGCLYLNTGSCGRKPTSVIATLSQGWSDLNENPTLSSFLDQQPWNRAHQAASTLFDVPASSILLTQNTTQGLQLIMQSLLVHPGDELITTNHEHGSLNTIARYLEETRGVVVRRLSVDPFAGSSAFCFGVLELVTKRTKLIALSEINCLTGWRPDLTLLIESLEMLELPLLADGAHAPGQMRTRPGRFPLWVGSGHKWLGGPNGTGFAYVAPQMVPRLEPVALGDRFFERKDENIEDLSRFEWPGTTDLVRWLGLARACELFMELGDNQIEKRQRRLMQHLRQRLKEELNPQFRTPDDETEASALLAFHFEPQRLKVNDLREALWSNDRIWVQPDFLNETPGHGMRISCHCSLTEHDLDQFISALAKYVSDG